MHLIHLDHLNASGRADGLNGLAMCLDPVVDGNMAAFQEPANGTKTKPFKVKLERLPLGCRAYPPILDSIPIPTGFTSISLFFFDDAVFAAIGRTTFWTIHIGLYPYKLGKCSKYYTNLTIPYLNSGKRRAKNSKITKQLETFQSCLTVHLCFGVLKTRLPYQLGYAISCCLLRRYLRAIPDKNASARRGIRKIIVTCVT